MAPSSRSDPVEDSGGSGSTLGTILSEDLNFLLTNRIPRRLATQFIGWFSRIENPAVAAISIAVWRMFARDMDLSEARQQSFASMHACFTRELKPGARVVDDAPYAITSPCDALVGAHGLVRQGLILQAKGMPYTLAELLGDRTQAATFENGLYVTLRIKSSFYHRMHAPSDGRLDELRYISGDTWNVNPIALKRVERLFCRNERAVMEWSLGGQERIAMVPVAAILVSSMQFNFLEGSMDLRQRGLNRLKCSASFRKGDELGFFQHGSTIILLLKGSFEFTDHVRSGALVRVGQALFRRLQPAAIGSGGGSASQIPTKTDHT